METELIKQQDWQASIIAVGRHDDDYSDSGWICWHVGSTFYLAQFSHCSCYGTWESLAGEKGEGYWDENDDFIQQGRPEAAWAGTYNELLLMASKGIDPCLPDRTADPEDYDYAQLIDCYRQIQAIEEGV